MAERLIAMLGLDLTYKMVLQNDAADDTLIRTL